MRETDSPIALDYVEWDVLNWSRCLPLWSAYIRRYPPGKSRVLCVGERHGGLSLWFASQGFQVVCSDFGGPSSQARELHARFKVGSRIEYLDMDIFNSRLPDDQFEIVACKSVIGGLRKDPKDKKSRTIENQKLAVQEMKRILKPGGAFLGAENMKGSILHQWMRRAAKGKRIGWRHLSVGEVKWLFDEFADLDVRYFGVLGTLYRSPWINRVFHSVDRILSAVMPNSWLYISFICARKAISLCSLICFSWMVFSCFRFSFTLV